MHRRLLSQCLIYQQYRYFLQKIPFPLLKHRRRLSLQVRLIRYVIVLLRHQQKYTLLMLQKTNR
jgi:hypothetical protein